MQKEFQKYKRTINTECPRFENRGKKNWNWKGDKVGLPALHDWIRRQLGNPSVCAHCGTKTATKYDWANISREYKRDISDWMRLCRPCHRNYDFTEKTRHKMVDSWRERKLKCSPVFPFAYV